MEERFTDNFNETVTDNLTGLMWTKNANLPRGWRTWQHALDYVAKLNIEAYFGYTDWRMPTIEEMKSLVGHSQCNPVLPAGHPFTDVENYYWSSSTCDNYTGDAWIIYMDYGRVHACSKFYYCYVWPVRKEG